MSRILFNARACGQTVPVAVGYDRRLSECFVSINVMAIEGDEEDMDAEKESPLAPIYAAAASGLQQGLDVDDCKRILSAAGIVAPQGTYDLLAEHVRLNAGNVIVQMEDDGTARVLHEG